MTPVDGMTPADISVVIPTLNEAGAVGAAIESARRAGATEIIVCDGGSRDSTRSIAASAGAAKVVSSLPGRGIQLNAGAMFASKRFVLFLHADNQLGADCLRQICQRSTLLWGAFGQRIDSAAARYRLLEWGNAQRVRWRRMPFGDQGIFVQRAFFKAQGGFAEIPLMEDVELAKRLRRLASPALLAGPVLVSPRRWQQRGVLRQTLLNWSLQLRYSLGASPEQLCRRYHEHDSR